MSLRTWGAAFVAAAVVAVAPAGMAQAAAASPAGAQVNPTSEALVKRYLAAIHFEKLLDTMLGAMLPVMADSMVKEHPEITPQQRQIVIDTVRDTMREKFVPRMIEKMTPIYAETFSQSELQAIVTFYESPAGRAITEKSPSMAPKSAEITRQLMPEMQREVAVRLCAKINCAAPKPAASATPRAS